MLFIASDHGGYKLKEALKTFFAKLALDFEDIGPVTLIPDDDYPEYTLKLVEKMREAPENRGILICRNGVGVSMLANKFKNIRALLAFDPKQAETARTDDDTNVLALPADFIDPKKAQDIVMKWLETPFSREDRHLRRLSKVQEYGQE